jgi:COP9 signalosome complex subunit 12
MRNAIRSKYSSGISLNERGTYSPRRLILTYLIPCHLLTTHTLPTLALLSDYPHLQTLFLPLSRCIKKGDLSGFDAALIAGEEEFVKRRIYLTLERGRDIALRNLLRKVFIAGGFEEAKEANAPPVRRTRIPVAEFGAAISIGSKETMDNDEVECLLANMIYKVRFGVFFGCPYTLLALGSVFYSSGRQRVRTYN